MSEKQAEYEIEVKRQSAFDGQYVYLWVEKFWPSVTFKSRGSQMNHGYTLFPRGQLVVKFQLTDKPTDDREITVDQLATLLEQSINALAPSYKTFVNIEDSQDSIRDGDF